MKMMMIMKLLCFFMLITNMAVAFIDDEEYMLRQVHRSLDEESVHLGELLRSAEKYNTSRKEDVVKNFREKYATASFPQTFSDVSPDIHVSFDEKEEFHDVVAHFKAMAKSIHASAQEDDEFTCGSLPNKYDPHYLCSDIVDYEFLLLPNITADGLNSFGSGWMKLFTRYLGADCLSDVKRLICSVLYKPCVPNVVPGDISTYQSSEWGIALPFLRPCGGICQSTTSAGTSCGGLLEAFGLAPNCGGYSLATNTASSWYLTYDYFSTPVSQATNTTTGPYCNDLASSQNKQLVHDQKEKYVGSYCEGVKDQWWHPESNDFDSSLAPFLPPYVLQNIIDDYMYERFESPSQRLVPYANTECYDARRIHLCTMWFLEAYPSTALSAFFGTIYVPSFPHRSNCRSYEQECSVERDCGLKINAGQGDAVSVYLFPQDRQVVESLDIGTGTNLEITSAPYKLDIDEVDTEYTPSCPTKYKYDSDPVSERSFVFGGCALECPGVSKSNEEFQFVFSNRRIANWFAVAVGFLQILNLSIIKTSRQNIFILGSVFAVLLFNFLQAIVLELHAKHPRSLSCVNDTTWRDVEDFGDDSTTTLCTITAIIGIYQRYFTMAVMICLAIDLWLRIVLGKKDKYVNQLRWYYMTITGLLMIAGAIFEHFYRGNGNIIIAGGAFTSCNWIREDKYEQFYIFLVPMIISVGISFFLFGQSCYIVIKTSLKVADVDKKPLRKLWRNYSMIFLFVLYHLILYPFTIGIRSYYHQYEQDKIADSILKWHECVFTHSYDHNNPNNYIGHCGEYPKVRESLLVQFVDIPLLYFTACILFYITLYKEVRIFWTNNFRRLLLILGIKKAVQHVLPTKQGKILSLVGQPQLSAILSSYVTPSSNISIGDESEDEKENKKGIEGTLRLFLKPFQEKRKKNMYIPRLNGSVSGTAKVVPTTSLPTHDEEDEMVMSQNSKNQLVQVDDHISNGGGHITIIPCNENIGQETERGTILEDDDNDDDDQDDDDQDDDDDHNKKDNNNNDHNEDRNNEDGVEIEKKQNIVIDKMNNISNQDDIEAGGDIEADAVMTVTNPHCNTVSQVELV